MSDFTRFARFLATANKRHLHRYLSEFDFRYINREARGVDDITKFDLALRGIVGKRLTYETTGGRA